MKLKISHTLLLVLTAFFIITIHASPIQNSLNQPSKTLLNNKKRDVVDLHNTGSKTTTTTTTTATQKATATPQPTKTPDASPATSNPVVIYGGSGITPQNGVAGAFLIVLGIYLMIFGFKSFRITLGVCGFLTFGLITWVAMANNQPYYGYANNDITLIAVPAGLGILGAIVYTIFWNITIYLVGAMSGLTLALYIMCCRESLLITSAVARAAFMVSLSFFISLVTFFAEKYVLLFTFSWVGSYCFIVGIEFLAHTGYLAGLKSILDGNKYHQVIYTISRNTIILIAFIPIIFLISFAWQHTYNKNLKFGVIYEEKKKPEGDGGKDKKEESPGDPGPVDKSEVFIEVEEKK